MKKYVQNRLYTLVITTIIFFSTANGQIAPDLDIGHPCFFIVPANLVADSISSSSARLSATIRESRIVFKYKAVTSDAWLSSSPTDPVWIMSLSPATQYEYYAIGTSLCPSSSPPVSKTSAIAYFTTLKAPSSKTSVSSLSIFPVPIQNSATISFSLTESKNVSIKIFDLSGRSITTIAGGQLQPGDHQFIWNGKNEKGKDLNTGIYFLRIETEDQIETRKIIMVR
jgi:flagellar hook capping protein FlgD